MNPWLVPLAWVALIPRNIAVAILRVYQTVVSPLYGDVCRYHPSCSHYALDGIARYGVLVGTVLGARRLVRCHPWAKGGIDDVPPRTHNWSHQTRAGFAVPNVK
ncbi:MAG: membrane protein insertion efficiency factor YidD [Microbacteriaceae bacterium]